MYEVRQSQNGLWEVVDQTDATIFRGTKRQCEDWLDAAENSTTDKPSQGFLFRLKQLFMRQRGDGSSTK